MILTDAIIMMTFLNSVLIWTELIGPPGQLMMLAYAYMANVKNNIGIFCLLEIMGMKTLTWKVWKSIPPVNEDFFARFLWRVNLVLGGFYGVVMVMVNNGLFRGTELFGQSTREPTPMNYELTPALSAFTLICIILMVSLIFLAIISEGRSPRGQVT